jgi:hypothetical protein
MYGKLFTSLYQGTLRGCADEILVFTNLIAHADAHGCVDKHYRAIAEETGISIDRVKAAIANLEAPDPESRSPEEGGRRIIPLDDHRAWGWLIVNYGKYRAIRNEDDRREQNRLAQQRWRDKQKEVRVSTVSQDKPRSAQAEEEEEEEEEEVREVPQAAPTRKKGTRLPDPFVLTAEMRAYAAERNPGVDPVIETEKFCNYFRSAPGQKGVKLDWGLTWKNWILNARGNGHGTNRIDKGRRDSSVDRLRATQEIINQYPTEAELRGES